MDDQQHDTPHGGTPPTRDHSLQRLVETADYVCERTLQIDSQVTEAEYIAVQISALTRQLRTLASNTTLEATRLRLSGPLAEIARQMRRISQQMSEANDQLGLSLRAYTVATGELRQAAGILLNDARTLESGEDEERDATMLRMPATRLDRPARLHSILSPSFDDQDGT